MTDIYTTPIKTEADAEGFFFQLHQLAQLRAQLAQAVKDCERYRLSPSQVRNCPSDLQNLDAAWRKRQTLEYQIHQLELTK